MIILDCFLSCCDVNDFVILVIQVVISGKGNQVWIEIIVKGFWCYQVQVINNQLKIEVIFFIVGEINCLVLYGQEGKKVFINFYDVDLVMVLCMLVEILGCNVIVDFLLNGCKVMVMLDNMFYD